MKNKKINFYVVNKKADSKPKDELYTACASVLQHIFNDEKNFLYYISFYEYKEYVSHKIAMYKNIWKDNCPDFFAKTLLPQETITVLDSPEKLVFATLLFFENDTQRWKEILCSKQQKGIFFISKELLQLNKINILPLYDLFNNTNWDIYLKKDKYIELVNLIKVNDITIIQNFDFDEFNCFEVMLVGNVDLYDKLNIVCEFNKTELWDTNSTIFSFNLLGDINGIQYKKGNFTPEVI